MFIKKSFLFILFVVFIYSCQDNRKESLPSAAYVDTFSVMKQYDQAKIIEDKYDALLKSRNLVSSSTAKIEDQEYINQLEERKNAALDSLNRNVNKIIYEYAHNNGYNNVYASGTDSAKYKGKKNDITQQIIVLLNSQVTISGTDAAGKSTTKSVQNTGSTVNSNTVKSNQVAINEAKEANLIRSKAYQQSVAIKKREAINAVTVLEDQAKKNENELSETKRKLEEAKNDLDNLVISDAKELDNIVFDSDSIVNEAIKNVIRDSLAIHPVIINGADVSNKRTNSQNLDLAEMNAESNTEKVSGLEIPSDSKDSLAVGPELISAAKNENKKAIDVNPKVANVSANEQSQIKEQQNPSLETKETDDQTAVVDSNGAASISSLLKILDEFNTNQTFLSQSLDSISTVFENDNSNKLLSIATGSKENQFFDTVCSQINDRNLNQNALLSKFELLYDGVLKQESTQSASNLYLNTLNKLNSDQKNIEVLYANLFEKVKLYKNKAIESNNLRIKNANNIGKDAQAIAENEKLEYLKRTAGKTTPVSNSNQFDFGYQLVNLQVLKNMGNVESAYYLILAVHQTSAKADTFMSQVIASGQKNIMFFYNLNYDSYFIYTEKFDTEAKALKALEARSDAPYNAKMVVVKFEQ